MPALAFLGVFTTFFCWFILDFLKYQPHEFSGSTVVHSLLGIVLGLFLVFRTNSAYDRWWEGRKLWGSMVNNSRSLAVKLNTYLLESADRNWYARMISNFVFGAKEHLRFGTQLSELELSPEERLALSGVNHKPNMIINMIYGKIERAVRSGELRPEHLINLDKELKEYMDIVGACERIKYTPIPYSYSMYLKKFLFIYILTLPFGFINTFGYITIPIVIIVAFILLSVELIAEEIEDPFGKDINDLPTDELADKIKSNVHEILGAK